MTRIGIIGAGAIGSIVGGFLTKAGHDVTLIDQWVEHVDAIKRDGLQISLPEEELTVPVAASHIHELQANPELFDLAFVAVKGYDTVWATHLIAPHVREEGAFVDFQNGINDETIAGIVGRERTLGCVITIGAGLYEPGHAIRTDSRDQGFAVGELDGSPSDRAAEIAELMNAVEGTRVTTNLWGDRWAKLAVNCMANPVAGLTGYGSRDVRVNDNTRGLCIRIAAEVIEVGRAHGHDIPAVWGIDSQRYVDVAGGADSSEVDAELIAGAQVLGEGRPSFLQDVMRGRRTEIDYLNGWVAERGREVEVPTPANDAIAQVVRSFKVGELKPDPANLQPVLDLL